MCRASGAFRDMDCSQRSRPGLTSAASMTLEEEEGCGSGKANS